MTIAGTIAATGTARYAAAIDAASAASAGTTAPAAHAAILEGGRLDAAAHEIAVAIAVANTCCAACGHVPIARATCTAARRLLLLLFLLLR